ncbi:MAG: hypothetical protein ACR2LR_03320 [Hassallia sp.]
MTSRFFETTDIDGDLLIFNLEGIALALKDDDGVVTIRFVGGPSTTLSGENADNFWEFLSGASYQVPEPKKA